MPYTPFSVCIRPLEEEKAEGTEEKRRKKKKEQLAKMGNCIVSKKTKAREKQEAGKQGTKGSITGGGCGGSLTVANAKEYSW